MLVTLKYLADLPLYEVEKPYTLYGYPEEVTPKTNCQFRYVDTIEAADIRGRESEFKLTECGFESHHKPSLCTLHRSTFEKVEGREMVWQYLQETMRFGEEILKASKVLCFDWRFRRTNATCGVEDQLADLENARFRALSPAALVHCDYSYDGGLDTLKIHLRPEEYDDIMTGRCRAKIINVWRPLQTVNNTPLILCDRQSVHSDDVLEVDQVSPAKVELSLSLKYNHSQKYYWLSNQSNEEILMFTSWDSVQSDTSISKVNHGNGTNSGLSACQDHTPHGAYVDESSGSRTSPRESVEVRLIMMWPASS